MIYKHICVLSILLLAFDTALTQESINLTNSSLFPLTISGAIGSSSATTPTIEAAILEETIIPNDDHIDIVYPSTLEVPNAYCTNILAQCDMSKELCTDPGLGKIYALLCPATCILSCKPSNSTLVGKLLMVQAFIKHGSEAPLIALTKSNFDSNFNNTPLGNLLPKGMNEMYIVGKKLRRRYGNDLGLITSDFNAFQVSTKSTGVEKTISSAMSLLNGLYDKSNSPNITGSRTNSFTPMPVFTNFLDTNYQWIEESVCPNFNNLLKSRVQMDYFKKINSQNADFIKLLGKASNKNSTDIFDYFDFIDTMRIYKANNISTVSYMNQSLYDYITELQNIVFGARLGAKVNAVNLTENGNMTKLSGGFMIQNMLDNAALKQLNNSFSNRSSTDTKIYLNIMDDSTYSSIMDVLGNKTLFTNSSFANPGSAMIFEIYEYNNTFKLQVAYLPDYASDFKVNQTQGVCDADSKTNLCTLSQFKSKVQKYLPGDVYSSCGLPKI
uniref:ShKT domain-containing protein n=1 Tax=Rhabditophanes sp. KR3021 TaxID=114890 RepID=A0AC35TFY5_9BILA